MKTKIAILLFMFVAVFSSAQSSKIPLDANNPRFPDERLITAGQPSVNDFATLKKNGVKKIINLRPEEEDKTFDEGAAAKKYGIDYVHIPIDGVRGITKENAKILHDVLAENDEKVFIHCSSGNRVGALLALKKFYYEGKTAIEAFEYGKKSGMTSLGTHVLTELSHSPAEIK